MAKTLKAFRCCLIIQEGEQIAQMASYSWVSKKLSPSVDNIPGPPLEKKLYCNNMDRFGRRSATMTRYTIDNYIMLEERMCQSYLKTAMVLPLSIDFFIQKCSYLSKYQELNLFGFVLEFFIFFK